MVLHVKIRLVLPFLAHPAKSHLAGRASAHSKPPAKAGHYPWGTLGTSPEVTRPFAENFVKQKLMSGRFEKYFRKLADFGDGYEVKSI